MELLNRFPFARWAPIPLRLIVGYGFMVHGFAKLARGPDAFAIVLCALGVPAPHFMASGPTFKQVPEPTQLQAKAYQLLTSLPVAGI